MIFSGFFEICTFNEIIFHMKKFKRVVLIIMIFLGLCFGVLYSTGYGYMINMVEAIIKTKRTSAGLNDYLYFENREIPSSKTPQPWPLHPSYNTIQSTEILTKIHQELETVAFLIIKNDSLWHEQYFDGYGPDSKSNSFSMSKSMVSAALGRAIDEGAIENLNQKASRFLPWLNNGYAAKVTVGDLSSMASGLQWNEDYENLLEITPRTYVEKDMGALMQTIPVISNPGERFVYQSGNTQLLSMALESATGKNISTLISEYFWDPMGAEHSALWQIDSQKMGLEKAYCCFNSNARDFARFGKLYKNHGRWEGQQLLDSTFVAKSIQPRFIESPEYGFGWWLGDIDGNAYFSMRGHLGQYVAVFPEQDVIIVRLGHQKLEDFPHKNLPMDFPIYIREAFKMLTDVYSP